MSGCTGAKLLAKGAENEKNWLEARLELSKGGFNHSFVTRNELNPPHSMNLYLVDGPFSSFSGKWEFIYLETDACKVVFSLNFEFANRLLGFTVGKIFEKIASDQVQNVCDRAKEIYCDETNVKN